MSSCLHNADVCFFPQYQAVMSNSSINRNIRVFFCLKAVARVSHNNLHVTRAMSLSICLNVRFIMSDTGRRC